MAKYVIAVVMLGMLFAPLAAVHAAPAAGTVSIKLPNFLGCENAQCLLEQILHALWILASLLTTIMILVGAFQMLTAAGNPEKIETAKKTILYAVIGFAVVILAWSADTIIKGVLESVTGTGPGASNPVGTTNNLPCDPNLPGCAGD